MNRLLRAALPMLALVLAACAGSGPAATGAGSSAGATGPFLYVTAQGDALVTVIDMATNEIAETIDLRRLGFSENAKPHHIVVEPDGSHWYVSLIGENRVLKFNRANELVGQAEFEVPGMLALDPASDRLFVGRSMSAVNPPQRIGIIDRDGMTVDEVDVFFPRPHALNVSPDGRHVYSASLAVNQMASVDVSEEAVEVHDVDGPHHMFVQFAIAPDGKTMITGGQMSGQLLVFDLSDPANPARVATLDVPAQPWHPVFTPDGRYAYIPAKEGNAVAVYDAAQRAIVHEIRGEGLAQPHGAAVSPDGRYVYVTNNNLNAAYTPKGAYEGDAVGTVVVIDTATNEIVKVIEVGHYPTGVGAAAGR